MRFWNGYRTWRWSYIDLDAGIRRFVAYLDRHGIGSGDRLVLWADSRPEWVAVFWACLARGVQVVPLDYHSSPEFVNRIVMQTKARLLVHSGVAASPTSPLERFAIESLNGLPDGPRFSPTPASGNDVVEIVYTSGTTAEPKGVIHLHRNICANLDPIRQEIDRYKKWAVPFQPIRILDLLPLSHMFGQSLGIFIPLLLDGSAAFMTGLHPAAIRQTIRRERISVLVCVPRILDSLRTDIERHHPRSKAVPVEPGGPLRRWWHHRDIHRAFGLKFWAFVVGGAMLNPETEAFWSRIGLLVLQGYGLTETSPVVSVNHPFRARRGTLGEVIGGQEVRIADDGEILVRGDSVVGEYLETGTRRARAVDEDGWFHTGDIGDRDAEGRLILADALSYGRKIGLSPMIDIATLTGAVKMALADVCTGAFTNSRPTLRRLLKASAATGEKIWELPMFEEYKDMNKSDVADVKNTGGRLAGATTAAFFLAEFAETTPWVHLDIAGTARKDSTKGYMVKGASGAPVRTLVQFVLDSANGR